ncbi:MAG TPA: hypothetical protein VNE86_01905 [Nitrososphaerales archaeon]|nr:hypothetical protein [Nitrososphaerales archaeon]
MAADCFPTKEGDDAINELEIQDGLKTIERYKFFTDKEWVDLEKKEGITKRILAQVLCNQSINLGAYDVASIDWSKISKAEILELCRQELKDMVHVKNLIEEDERLGKGLRD